MRGTILEHLYEMSVGLHKAGLLSDEELRQHDLECRPRRAMWRVRLGDTLDGWATLTERFFYWDLLWQERLESFLRKRLGSLRKRLIALWQGQADDREAIES